MKTYKIYKCLKKENNNNSNFNKYKNNKKKIRIKIKFNKSKWKNNIVQQIKIYKIKTTTNKQFQQQETRLKKNLGNKKMHMSQILNINNNSSKMKMKINNNHNNHINNKPKNYQTKIKNQQTL